MRFPCRFAIALGLSFPAGGMPCEQDAAGSAKASPQTPAAPTARKEKAPAQTTPFARQNAKRRRAPASGTAKLRKRAAAAPDGVPRKIVVREGGASEPAAQIAPGMTPAEAARERQNAEQLLGAAGDQVKQLAGRTLDARQQETVGQIRNYMAGARSALQEGDVRRASTLAQKAHLLAEDLVKH